MNQVLYFLVFGEALLNGEYSVTVCQGVLA